MDRLRCIRKPLLIPVLLSVAASLAQSPVSAADPAPERLRKFVFTVNAYSRTDGKDMPNDPRWRRNVGTAFPVDERGYLMTLSCVLRNAERIQVTDSEGGRFEASLVGVDQTGGIGVLKILKNDGAPVSRIASVRAVRSGSRVTFVGTPAGGELTATEGSVESVYDDGSMVVTVDGEPGTSGTPVFNDDGQAIGLLAYHIESDRSEAVSRAGSYLVFPMEYAALMARSIINRFEGRSGWMGVSAFVNDLAVREVYPGSPAEKAGLRPGDRLLEFNGKQLSSPEDLVRASGATRPGDTARVKVARNGDVLSLTLRLAEFPSTDNP